MPSGEEAAPLYIPLLIFFPLGPLPPLHPLECTLHGRVRGEHLLAVQIQAQATGALQHAAQRGASGS